MSKHRFKINLEGMDTTEYEKHPIVDFEFNEEALGRAKIEKSRKYVRVESFKDLPEFQKRLLTTHEEVDGKKILRGLSISFLQPK